MSPWITDPQSRSEDYGLLFAAFRADLEVLWWVTCVGCGQWMEWGDAYPCQEKRSYLLEVRDLLVYDLTGSNMWVGKANSGSVWVILSSNDDVARKNPYLYQPKMEVVVIVAMKTSTACLRDVGTTPSLAIDQANRWLFNVFLVQSVFCWVSIHFKKGISLDDPSDWTATRWPSWCFQSHHGGGGTCVATALPCQLTA